MFKLRTRLMSGELFAIKFQFYVVELLEKSNKGSRAFTLLTYLLMCSLSYPVGTGIGLAQ